MASIALSTSTKTVRSEALNTAIDDGGAATLYFYTDPQPATADEAIGASTQLAAVPCPTAPFGTVTDGVLTSHEISNHLTTEGTGSATWARLINGAGTTIGDFTVGGIGSGANIEMQSTQFYPGVIVAISSFVVTEV